MADTVGPPGARMAGSKVGARGLRERTVLGEILSMLFAETAPFDAVTSAIYLPWFAMTSCVYLAFRV